MNGGAPPKSQGWPGRNTPLTPQDASRLIAADASPRSEPFFTAAIGALRLRIDETHELPIVVIDEADREVARFRWPANCARFLGGERTNTASLPAEIVARYRDIFSRSPRAS
jgi:hypothetical protein